MNGYVVNHEPINVGAPIIRHAILDQMCLQSSIVSSIVDRAERYYGQAFPSFPGQRTKNCAVCLIGAPRGTDVRDLLAQEHAAGTHTKPTIDASSRAATLAPSASHCAATSLTRA